MINCVIIDDEKPAIDALTSIINSNFSHMLNIVGAAQTVQDGIACIHQNKPDLVFLDIVLPDGNGLTIFDHIKDPAFAVIFVTAYNNYAIDAIRVSAVDYILKPIIPEELASALKRYETNGITGIQTKNIERLKNAIKIGSLEQEKIALPVFHGYQFEKVHSIMYCEADQNYTRIFTTRGDNYMISKALGYVEKLLPSNIFFKIHKSIIVNLNYIVSYSRENGYKVTLENGKVLDVATRRNEAFLQVITKLKY